MAPVLACGWIHCSNVFLSVAVIHEF